MNLRRLDVRMALPDPPRRATVLGELPQWRDGLPTVGLELRDPTASVDLVVAPARMAREAIATRAPMLILEGRGSRAALRGAGLRVRRFLPIGAAEAPDLLLSLEASRATGYALGRLRAPEGLAKRARNAGVRAAIAVHAFPDLDRVQTVVLRTPAPPFLLARATSFGVDPRASWFQTMGGGDELARGVFHLFAPGATEPQWVIKFARVPGYDAPFEADSRGLELVAHAGGPAAAHAPRLLGRFAVGGFEASAETAIVGEPLSRRLVAGTPLANRLALVERIAGWTVDVARATAASPAALQPELDRLERDVLPRWTGRGAPDDLVRCLPPLRGVLAHNDLGSWNVIVGRDTFGVVDWESARAPALAMWDALYFLVDALTLLAGARTPTERVEGSLGLLRGDAPLSPVLFRWLMESARATGMPPDAVGPVSTLCWLHHGLSHRDRWSRVEWAGGEGSFVPPAEQIAPSWLRDPALGADWPAWRAYVAANG